MDIQDVFILRVPVTAIMKNHVFTFVNEIRKDTKGALIGLKLTCRRNEFAARLDEMAIVMKMNKRYVDDIKVAVQSTPLAMTCKDGQTFVDESYASEDNRKSTAQSSTNTSASSVAGNAVDGNANAGHCSQTQQNDPSWWEVTWSKGLVEAHQ